MKEACSTAAHLRTLCHRTPISIVPMLRTLGNSCPFRVLYFWKFRDFSRVHRWILNEPKSPQAIYKVHLESKTHCFTQVKFLKVFITSFNKDVERWNDPQEKRRGTLIVNRVCSPHSDLNSFLHAFLERMQEPAPYAACPPHCICLWWRWRLQKGQIWPT